MGWGTAPHKAGRTARLRHRPPPRPPSRALAALQAPSCPQNTVAQPSLRPQEDEDGLGRIKGTVRRGHPWHTAAPCPPCTPPGRLPVSQRRAGLSWQWGTAHRRAQGEEEDGRYGARKGGRHVPACGTQPCARPGASPPPGAAFLPLHPPRDEGDQGWVRILGTPSWPFSMGLAFGKAEPPCPRCWERFSLARPALMVPRDTVAPCPGTRRCSPR